MLKGWSIELFLSWAGLELWSPDSLLGKRPKSILFTSWSLAAAMLIAYPSRYYFLAVASRSLASATSFMVLNDSTGFNLDFQNPEPGGWKSGEGGCLAPNQSVGHCYLASREGGIKRFIRL